MSRTLMIVLLRADKTVSGLAFRLMTVWKYINDNYPEKKMFLLTNKTLWEKMFPDDSIADYKNVYWFNDQKNYKIKVIFLWVWALFLILKNRINTIHTAGQFFLIPILYFRKIFNFSSCVTIGSASIQMASTYGKNATAQWDAFLKKSTNVDILNPTHEFHNYKFRKFISPCSFPFIMTANKPIDLNFKNTDRENYIMYVGSMIDLKNPIFCIEGFVRMLELHIQDFDLIEKKPTLILIGKGPLRKRVSELQVEINERFGYEAIKLENDDKLIYSYLSRSKIFLSLFDLENYPSQSLMEGMLFCNKLIVTPYGDTKLLVKPELGNTILTDKNVDELANAMFHTLINWKLDDGNHNFIIKNHNIEIFSKYFLNIHEII